MTEWRAGQKAAIDRRMIVTIDRVTPSGIVKIGKYAFNPDGRERMTRTSGYPYNSPKRLELLTPEVEAETRQYIRDRGILSRLGNEIEELTRLAQMLGPRFRDRKLTPTEIAWAERVLAALEGIKE